MNSFTSTALDDRDLVFTLFTFDLIKVIVGQTQSLWGFGWVPVLIKAQRNA